MIDHSVNGNYGGLAPNLINPPHDATEDPPDLRPKVAVGTLVTFSFSDISRKKQQEIWEQYFWRIIWMKKDLFSASDSLKNAVSERTTNPQKYKNQNDLFFVFLYFHGWKTCVSMYFPAFTSDRHQRNTCLFTRTHWKIHFWCILYFVCVFLYLYFLVCGAPYTWKNIYTTFLLSIQKYSRFLLQLLCIWAFLFCKPTNKNCIYSLKSIRVPLCV